MATPRGTLALAVTFHHRLPGLGAPTGRDWTATAIDTYWPIVRALTNVADSGPSNAATLVVSPAWTALASDGTARARARAELDRRCEGGEGHWRGLREFVAGRWGHDLLGAVRGLAGSGAVELATSFSSWTWGPAFVGSRTMLRALVGLAAADHARSYGLPSQGLWPPMFGHLADADRTLARYGLRYQVVDGHALRRGTTKAPAGAFAPLVAASGVAAFGTDPLARDWDRSKRGAGELAESFLRAWTRSVASAWSFPEISAPISINAISASELGGAWTGGALWLEETIKRASEGLDDWRAGTVASHLDRFPESVLGRPSTSVGGPLAVRPGNSDVLDRAQDVAEALETLIGTAPPKTVAELVRSLLRAVAMDWSFPPGFGIDAAEGLEQASAWLARARRLAGLGIAGEEAEALTIGPPFLPEVPLALLGPA